MSTHKVEVRFASRIIVPVDLVIEIDDESIRDDDRTDAVIKTVTIVTNVEVSPAEFFQGLDDGAQEDLDTAIGDAVEKAIASGKIDIDQ